MPKSWCSAPAGRAGGSSYSGGSWRRHRRSPPPSASTAAGSSAMEEIFISSGDEEEQPPPSYIGEAALTDEDFVRQMEIMTERSLRDMRPSPRVKPEPPSPPRHGVKVEPGATVKEEPASPRPQNRGVQIGRRVKVEPASPPRHNSGVQEEPASPPHSRYALMHASALPPRRYRLAVKSELPPAIKKARGRLLHYLGGGGYGGPLGSRAVVSEAERVARQRERYDQRNAGGGGYALVGRL